MREQIWFTPRGAFFRSDDKREVRKTIEEF